MTRLVTLANWLNPVPRAALALSCGLMAWHGSSMADPADPFSLKMSQAVSPDRFFIRAGVIGVKVKTKSGDTYDVTGPVLTQAQLQKLVDDPSIVANVLLSSGATLIGSSGTPSALTSVQADSLATKLLNKGNGAGLVLSTMKANNIAALGTPLGTKAVAEKSAGTAGISLGYYLDDEYKWLVEAYVLAAPISTYVTVAGSSTRQNGDTGVTSQKPLEVSGQKALTTKLLPPTVLLGRYWGNKDNKFRPYTGIAAMYSIFYDTKVTNALNSYVGGSNPGDTTATFKNTFGLGPMVGFKYELSDKWHVSLNVGHVKLKTEGTIVTKNTVLTDSTGAIQDFGPVSDNIATGISLWGGNAGATSTDTLAKVIYQNPQLNGVIGLITKASLALDADGNLLATPKPGLGTFVRKANATLDNTIFMLSVGHSF